MSLEACPECQHIIQSDVAACPHCGHQFRETTAQRLRRYAIRIAVVGVIVSAIVGVVFVLLRQGNSVLPG